MNLPPILFYSAIAVRTAIVVLLLVFGIRIIGKQGIGGMNLVDLLLILLLGNAIQNSITNGSGNLMVGLVSVSVLLLIDRFVGLLFVRNPILESQIIGKPVVLVTDGKIDQQAMLREEVNEEELIQAAHEMGLPNLRQVRLGILEEDGTISIIPKEDSD